MVDYVYFSIGLSLVLFLFKSMICVELHPQYGPDSKMYDFVKGLPFFFGKEGEVLYSDRNLIKSFPYLENGEDKYLVVKQYRNRTFFQRVAYGFFCKTKAKRAFLNAGELQKRHIATPRAVGYLEEYRYGLLRTSFLVTEYTNWKPISCFFNEPRLFDKSVAEKFAVFVAELHQKGILHHDLNSTNVLYHQAGNFALIDNNRMSFRADGNKLSLRECFDNLTRFTGDMALFEYVLRYYLKYRNWAPSLLPIAINIKIIHDKQYLRRKKILHKLK